MRKLSRKSKATPEWARQISELRERLRLNQSALGRRLQTSAMAVSRWERGVMEPPSNRYIEMGNIAGAPLCWYFWGRAGLRSEDVMKVMPTRGQEFQREHTPAIEIVTAGSGGKKLAEKVHLVAIPLLKIVVASYGEKGDDVPTL